ncbi:uncharacterized protein METZ01_LOCUS416834 [marine metagenome]|uniref:Fatty acid desaturase domain-containing protein n=1 Tax=marine metagenome TaxID=408172 RepID=A0A382WZH9_9ZZZZ
MRYNKQAFIIVHHLFFILGVYYVGTTYNPVYCLIPFMTGYLGGYLLIHRGFHLHFSHVRYVDTFFNKMLSFICVMFMGWLASPMTYALTHRQHHKYSDTDKDPHSPKFLSFWDILFENYKSLGMHSLIRDFAGSKYQKFLNKNKVSLHITFCIICTLIIPLLLIIISSVTVYFIWYQGLLNTYGHKNDDAFNCLPLFLITPWAWKHQDHHRQYVI